MVLPPTMISVAIETSRHLGGVVAAKLQYVYMYHTSLHIHGQNSTKIKQTPEEDLATLAWNIMLDASVL